MNHLRQFDTQYELGKREGEALSIAGSAAPQYVHHEDIKDAQSAFEAGRYQGWWEQEFKKALYDRDTKSGTA